MLIYTINDWLCKEWIYHSNIPSKARPEMDEKCISNKTSKIVGLIDGLSK
jgi:hypothetical protein